MIAIYLPILPEIGVQVMETDICGDNSQLYKGDSPHTKFRKAIERDYYVTRNREGMDTM